MQSEEEKWGIFWCGLLHKVIFDDLDGQSAHQYMENLCKKEVLMPDGRLRKPSLSTLKRKLKEYREGGLSALTRKIRSDRGKVRAVDDEILAKAIEFKREQPLRSDKAINLMLQSQYGKTISKTTLYRHLREAGATRLKLGISKQPVRKRWSRDYTHALWIGDFEDGPCVLLENGEVKVSHLCLFIDCYSRFVVEGRYYLREDLSILIDSLLRAWSTHGCSEQIYVDNAKIYYANSLKAACYELKIELLYRPAGDPAPGGLVERMFGTVQTQFEAEVRAGKILDLDELNRSFSAYLSVCYHQTVHSDTNQTPQERYQKGLRFTRHVDLSKVVKFFMKSDQRTVHPDFSDVQVHGNFYRVSPTLRGDRVIVRYDIYSDMEKVLLYSLKDEYLGEGVLHHREKGEKPTEPPLQGQPKHNFLSMLIAKHEKELHERARGIDYCKVVAKKTWPFAAFAQALAMLMGRKGGLASFTTQEYEALQKIYNRSPDLNEPKLTAAFERAAEKQNILSIAYELQNQFSGKEK
jgi:transposase InsO family protein